MARSTDDIVYTPDASTRSAANPLPAFLHGPAGLVRLDFAPRDRRPSAVRMLLVTVAAVAGSLAADALIAAIGVALFPSTKGYVHFRFADYGKLTVIGVLIACAAWPITTRITSQPRWMFFRMAVLVTLVLLLPDFWILYQGQPATAVGILMVMHLAIAVVTYCLLVNLTPTRPGRASRTAR
ncbi:MAG TPA: DUF6069 family protein [Actinocrinis sp.]|nr:DUF6069 family protein [Actinocrinis sp.]